MIDTVSKQESKLHGDDIHTTRWLNVLSGKFSGLLLCSLWWERSDYDRHQGDLFPFIQGTVTFLFMKISGNCGQEVRERDLLSLPYLFYETNHSIREFVYHKPASLWTFVG